MNRFPDNARVCFVGDSITHDNRYLMHIVSYYKSNFLGSNINFYNCGVSGGILRETLKTVETDALSYNPTHVVILMGINDSERDRLVEKRSRERYVKLKEAFENYKNNLEKLCNIFKERGIEIILCTCVPYDEYGEYCTSVLGGGLALIMAYNEFIREFARINNFGLCDYFPYMLEKMQTERIYSADSVHPLENGQYYIAKCFLENQGLSLGEKKEFSEKLLEWNEKVQIVRNIYAVEMMVIRDYNLSYSNGSQIVKKFMTSDECNEWFHGICECYLENKPRIETVKNRMVEIMEKEL